MTGFILGPRLSYICWDCSLEPVRDVAGGTAEDPSKPANSLFNEPSVNT